MEHITPTTAESIPTTQGARRVAAAAKFFRWWNIEHVVTWVETGCWPEVGTFPESHRQVQDLAEMISQYRLVVIEAVRSTTDPGVALEEIEASIMLREWVKLNGN